MGVDIHLITEIKKDNQWVYIEETPENFDCRNYYAFAILGNVRNGYGVTTFETKGLPKDISGMQYKYDKDENKYYVDFNSEYYYSHSYLTLKELLEYSENTLSPNKVFVSQNFYEMFLDLGGKLPKGMKFIGSKIKANQNLQIVEIIDDEDIQLEEAFIEGIQQLKNIKEKYKIKNDEDIRIVFAFDC